MNYAQGGCVFRISVDALDLKVLRDSAKVDPQNVVNLEGRLVSRDLARSVHRLAAESRMIYITQFIYNNPGQGEVFDQFESVATPIIARYNGRLLLRVRPAYSSFIEHRMKPYEIHFVEWLHPKTILVRRVCLLAKPTLSPFS